MRVALARLARGSLIYGVGSILQRFIGLLLLPFFTRVLSPEDYGVVALISIVGVAMSGLLTLGTGNSMGLLYFREDDRQKRPTIIWTNLLLVAVNGSFWFALLYVLAPVLSDLMFETERHAGLIRLAFLGSVLTTMADPFMAYLRMEEKAKQYVALTLLGSLISIGLSIYLVLWLRIGVLGLILAGTLGSAFSLGMIGLVVGRKLAFGLDRKLFVPLVRIGFPSIFGLFAFLLIDYTDRQMIQRMLGLSELGVYSVGYSFGIVMNIAMGAFATAWSPFFMSYVKKHEEAREVFARVLTYYVLGFGSLIVLFFFVAKPVVVLMTAPGFHEAWVVIGLVAAAFALKGCYLILLPGIYFADKLGRQSIIEWIAALLNIGLNLWLIPLYGIVGAAMATFASYLTLPVLAWAVARHYLDVDYQWRRLIASSGLIVVTGIGLYEIARSASEVWSVQMALSGALLIAFYALVYCILLNDQERNFIREKLMR